MGRDEEMIKFVENQQVKNMKNREKTIVFESCGKTEKLWKMVGYNLLKKVEKVWCGERLATIYS